MKIGFGSSDWSRSVKDDRGHPVWGGAGWARLGQYSSLLPFDMAVGSLAFHKGVFGVADWDGNHHFDCDIIYMQRVMFDDVPNRILQARANGQVIINDLDDWYWGLSPSNGAWAGSHPKNNPKENVNHYRKVLSASTLVTVSTPYLADRISQWVSRPIVLIPNFVDTEKFPIRTQTDGVPTVGWVGSTGHRSGDLEILKGILEPLVRSGSIRLHHSGHLERKNICQRCRCGRRSSFNIANGCPKRISKFVSIRYWPRSFEFRPIQSSQKRNQGLGVLLGSDSFHRYQHSSLRIPC